MAFDPIVTVPNLPAILSDAILPKPRPDDAVAWEVDQRSIQLCQWHIHQRPLGNKRENGAYDEEARGSTYIRIMTPKNRQIPGIQIPSWTYCLRLQMG